MLYHILYYMLYYYVLYKRYTVRVLYALLNVTLCVILYVVYVYYIIGDARLYHYIIIFNHLLWHVLYYGIRIYDTNNEYQ